jgi:CDGSH-type Zn-finger protein
VALVAHARIVVRDNASNRVYGPASIVDAEGNEIVFVPEGMHAALCRCGMSEAKPFCDSSHKHHGFEDCVRAASIADAEARLRPVDPERNL